MIGRLKGKPGNPDAIWKKLVMFGFPLMVGNIFQQLYSSVDSVIVGQFVGKEALAAIGSTTHILYLVISFFQGVSVGTNVIISQAIGAGNHDKVRGGIASSLWISLLSGLLLGGLFIALTPAMLRWTLLPEDIFDITSLYLRLYLIGLPGTAIYNVGTAVLRSMGDARRPLYFLVISSVVNTVLDIFLIRSCGMGVEGAAIATVISVYLSAALVLYVVLRKTGIYCLEKGELRLDWAISKGILYLGVPSAIQSSAVNLANVLFQSQVNVFGSTVLAGYSAANRLIFFLYVPVQAFGMVATTFVGQAVGAKNYNQVRETARVCCWMSVLISFLLGVAVYAANAPLLRMFTDDGEAIQYGVMTLLYIGLPSFLWAIPHVYGCAVTGMGKSVMAMAITMANMCIIRLVWLYSMLQVWNHFIVVLLSYPVSWITASACMLFYYVRLMKRVGQVEPVTGPVAETGEA